MKLTAIEKSFEDSARVIGGVFLLHPKDALRFVEECRKAQVGILGIEGFRLFEDGKIQPVQDHTADFDTRPEDSHQRAAEFLSQRINFDIWFEVVSADRS